MEKLTASPQGHYVDQFHAREPGLTSWGPTWLAERRRGAIARFADVGFPTRRDEEWKYTNLRSLTEQTYGPSAGECPVSREVVLEAVARDAKRLVFVNGMFSAEHSEVSDLPAGLTFEPLRTRFEAADARLLEIIGDEPAANSAFSVLGEAFFTDGVHLRVAPDTCLDAPIEVVFVGSDGFWAARNVLDVGTGAKLMMVETHLGGGFSTVVTDVCAGANASFEHIKIQRHSDQAHHFADLRAEQGVGSHYGNHFFSFGGRLTRNELRISVDGESAHCDLNGLFVTEGERHVDCHTTLDHRVPHCTSGEMYRGILADRSSGAFLGKINVYEDAQKTDAKQSCSNLLLSNDAEINAKPCLEIYADDVRCTHGATIGQLDEEALFYMRTRGIGRSEAQRIMTLAFGGTVVDGIPDEAIGERVRKLLLDKLKDIEVGT